MKYLVSLAALLFSAIALSAGTVAHVTVTYPTEATQLSQVTGQTVTVPLDISEIQKAVVKWYAGTTLVGQVDLIAPATKIDVPNLVCGNYNFTAYVMLKTTAAQSPDFAPPAVYATQITCSTVPKAPAVTVQ